MGGQVLKAPFPWFGGKSRAAELVWSRLGNVGNYVEPFAGSLAVLLARPHAPRVETVNDADCYLANFWRAVHSAPFKVAQYADWPVNETDLRARHKWLCNRKAFRERMLNDPHYYDAKVAGWWVWGLSQWIGAGWCSRPTWIGAGQGGRAPRGLNASIHISSAMGVHATRANLDGRAKRPVINRGARGVVNLSSAGGGYGRLPRMDRGGCGVDRRWRSRDDGANSERRPHLSDSGNGVHGKRPSLSGNGGAGVTSQKPIVEWMQALADRLRRVRVCCGEWSRIVTPSCTWKLGGGQLTGVLLDPPYSHSLRDNRLYAIERDVAADVRAWCVKNQDNPLLRIALCGIAGEHQLPGWTEAQWKAPRGYSKKGPREEVIWFSPSCLQANGQGDLFEGMA